jgi:hypothetical protein
MTHGVLCSMNEASYDSRRQLRPPDTSEITKCLNIDGLQLRKRCVNPCGKRVEHSRDVLGGKRPTFTLDRRALFI